MRTVNRTIKMKEYTVKACNTHTLKTEELIITVQAEKSPRKEFDAVTQKVADLGGIIVRTEAIREKAVMYSMSEKTFIEHPETKSRIINEEEL